MKKLMLFFALLAGMYSTSNAQTSMKMKDGVRMMNNKAMLCNRKKCTPLTATFTCADGCKVSPDGTVTKPDGTSMKLMNGYEIDKGGKTMMIAHGQAGHVCTKDCPMAKKM